MNRSLKEEFFYDNLQRLDYSELNDVQNLDVSYDLMGNITSKDDVGVGTWVYDIDKKHAVTDAAGNSFTYDDNGNQITRNSDDIEWTSYNYPKRVENGTQYHDYFYDSKRQRWKQEFYDGSSTDTTVFVGGIFEKYTSGATTQYRHIIKVGGRPIAQYTRYTGGGTSIEYFLVDHIGSVVEVIDAAGGVDVSENFDAYGQRRDASDWDGPISTGDEALIADASPRGFTFHTNSEESSLVHMNGRIADGLTGRFLSPDPYVPNPGITQSFNRYAYVRNNPLTFADPTGYFECFEFVSCTGSAIATVFSIFKPKRKRTPPKGCWVAGGANSCYGSSSRSRLFDVIEDIFDQVTNPFGLPTRSTLDDIILNVRDGRFDGFGIGGMRSVLFGGQSAGSVIWKEVPREARPFTGLIRGTLQDAINRTILAGRGLRNKIDRDNRGIVTEQSLWGAELATSNFGGLIYQEDGVAYSGAADPRSPRPASVRYRIPLEYDFLYNLSGFNTHVGEHLSFTTSNYNITLEGAVAAYINLSPDTGDFNMVRMYGRLSRLIDGPVIVGFGDSVYRVDDRSCSTVAGPNRFGCE